MSINRFDQASRYAAKLDAVGFLSWLLSESAEDLRFRMWLDTRTLPFPGDPERTCDTVAWLGDADPAIEWAVPVEFCLQPIADLFGRLLVYLGQVWLERRPTDAGGERFSVAAVAVNLTGRGHTSRDMSLHETGARTMLQVLERNLCDEIAADLLDTIADGSASRCLLPWIPLMHGGENADMIQRWKELAGSESDSRLRADYGGLALVFAEGAGRLGVWKAALKEWNVIESQQVLEWMQMGEAKGRAEGEAKALLRVLAKRFPPGATAEMATAIGAMQDLHKLDQWLDAALVVDSLEELRQKMQS